MNSKVRWGRKQMRRTADSKELKERIRILESDLDDAYSRLDRLEAYVMELADSSDAYLPSFNSKCFRNK